MATNIADVRRPPRKAAGGRRPPRHTGRGGRAAFVLMSPFFLLFTAVTLVPVGYAVYLSLYRTETSGLGFGTPATVFVGLGNYARTLGDSVFRAGFVHVLEYGLVYVPVMMITAMAAALLLDSTLAKASKFFQLAFFLPSQVPGILAAIIWLYLYTPHVSPVVTWLTDLGATPDLNKLGWALPAMANVAIWQYTGYNIVIFYAALKAVPREVVEAAAVDGAGEWRSAVSIKLPLIGPAATLAGMMTLVGVLQLFTEPLVIGGIATGSISAVWSPNLYLYNAAFADNDYATAAAGSILLALVAGGLSFLVIRLTRRWRDAA